MPRKISVLGWAAVLAGAAALAPAEAAEREQVRAVINLIAAIKMPFPEKLRNNQARTETVTLDSNGATTACLRLDDKLRWCYEHIAAVGARAEMLRVRAQPISDPVPGQVFQYAVDFDLDGQADLGSTTKIEGQLHAPVGVVAQFFHRGTGRGDQFRGDVQKLFDEGIQIALKHLGE
ncbi:MAG TPA: hypothetical protein VFY92_09235 [Hyphomicrobiaceae bacterium]|nr:hypothetical protein [Hyphomicrobiaceae bacterium]